VGKGTPEGYLNFLRDFPGDIGERTKPISYGGARTEVPRKNLVAGGGGGRKSGVHSSFLRGE